jgi:large subunit ribosomal protein L29
MQAKQMRDMPEHELTEQVADLRRELLDMRLSNATGELDDTAKLGRTRRDLARALTVARERALGIDTQVGA